MPEEVMVVETPEVVRGAAKWNPLDVLTSVYRSFTFMPKEEAERDPEVFIVAVSQEGGAPPEPVLRQDYYSDALDPIQARFCFKFLRKGTIIDFKRENKYLVFILK